MKRNLIGIFGILLLGFLCFDAAYSMGNAAWGDKFKERMKEKRKGKYAEKMVEKREAKQKEILAKSGNEEHLLTFAGVERRYVVHAPRRYDGKSALPVVLVLHGGMGTPELTMAQSGMDKVSDRNNFLAVYPQGLGQFPTWNAGTCCGYAKDNRIDDVGFIRVLLKDLAKNYSIDPKRVYSTGISNGGMMSYRLACEMPDQIAAIAPIAADMGVDGPKPSRPVPVIHFHGMKDENLLYAGGVGSRSVKKEFHQGAVKSIAWWVNINNCLPNPVETIKTNDYQMDVYEPAAGQNGAPVVFYSLFEGGHTWPGGRDVTAKAGTGQLIESVNASQIMWDFFKQYSL